jgi:predicted small lipoprotein YifL
VNSRSPLLQESNNLICIKVTIISKTINLNKTKQKMKKVIAIFAIAALTACGGKGTTEATTDSTAVAVDSTVVTADSTAVDTTVAPTTEVK